MSKPEVIISPDERGFWHADIYRQGWYEGAAPDGFMTGPTGGTRQEMTDLARSVYGDVTITDGITGTCEDCGEDHYNLETECNDCGGLINE